LYIFLSPHSSCTPCPSHPPWLYRCNNICRKTEVIKHSTVQFSPATSYFFSCVQIFSSAPSFQTPSVYVLHLMLEAKFHTDTKIKVKHSYRHYKGNNLWRHFRSFRFIGSRNGTIQKALKRELLHGTDAESCHVGAEWRDAM
jgi:hypothetical protein